MQLLLPERGIMSELKTSKTLEDSATSKIELGQLQVMQTYGPTEIKALPTNLRLAAVSTLDPELSWFAVCIPPTLAKQQLELQHMQSQDQPSAAKFLSLAPSLVACLSHELCPM